jgi:hypothetical protein
MIPKKIKKINLMVNDTISDMLTRIRNACLIKKTTVLYTNKIAILKNKEHEQMIPLITYSLLENPSLTKDYLFEYDTEFLISFQTLEHIFQTAYLHNHDTLIFNDVSSKNPTREIVKIFNILLKKYNKCFKNIIFTFYLKNQNENYYIFNDFIERLY